MAEKIKNKIIIKYFLLRNTHVTRNSNAGLIIWKLFLVFLRI